MGPLTFFLSLFTPSYFLARSLTEGAHGVGVARAEVGQRRQRQVVRRCVRGWGSELRVCSMGEDGYAEVR